MQVADEYTNFINRPEFRGELSHLIASKIMVGASLQDVVSTLFTTKLAYDYALLAGHEQFIRQHGEFHPSFWTDFDFDHLDPDFVAALRASLER